MKKFLLVFVVFFSIQVNAQVWVEISDASKILWQMQSDGVVWFRNMDEFDPAQGPCCYGYRLDTTTPGGKVIWSMIMAKMAAHARITLGFPDVGSNSNVQTLNYIGRHGHGTNE